MAESIPWDEIAEIHEDPLVVGDVLTGKEQEPPPGTVVEHADGRRWQRVARSNQSRWRRWRWAELRDGVAYPPYTRWQWRHITADGPVTVVQVPEPGQ